MNALGAAHTVPALLDERVAASPDATAFCTEDANGRWTPISWRDFHARSQALASGLVHHGLVRGERLALIAPTSLEWELLHHAALRAGIVVVGFDAHDLPERVALMCDTADISAIATTQPEIIAALTPARRQRLRFLVALPGSSAAAAADPALLPLQHLQNVAGGSGAPPAPEDTATIIFTSGTTGDPKGIAYTHAQVCLAIDAISDAFAFVGPGSHLLCWLPLSNLFQRMVNLAGMRRGAASYLLADPRRVMEVIAQVEPEVFIGVPRFYEKLYQGIQARIRSLPALPRALTRLAWSVARRSSACRLSNRPTPPGLKLAHRVLDRVVLRRVRAVMGTRLRCMVTGSAPTPAYLLHEFHAVGWLLLECYGLSENVLPMAMNRVDDFRFGSVGQPLAANKISIGADGAIAVRGPGVFAGYLGADGKTLPRAQEDHPTGDLGSIDGHGYLSLHGRSDDIVKTSTGHKISLPAVEAVLRSVEGIVDAVVVAAGRRYPVAICTTELEIADQAAMLKLEQQLKAALPALAPSDRPGTVFISNRILSIAGGELTGNLKVRRKTVQSNFAAEIEFMYAQSADYVSGHSGFRIYLQRSGSRP